MNYADVDDVLARLGRLRQAVGKNDGPDGAEITRFLKDISAGFDAEFGARGITVPLVDVTAVAALRPVVADGAALLTIDALFPDETPNSPGGRVAKRIEARYGAAVKALADGTHPVAMLLEVALEGAASRASSFWQAEPMYDLTEPLEHLTISPSVLPPFSKAMKL